MVSHRTFRVPLLGFLILQLILSPLVLHAQIQPHSAYSPEKIEREREVEWLEALISPGIEQFTEENPEWTLSDAEGIPLSPKTLLPFLRSLLNRSDASEKRTLATVTTPPLDKKGRRYAFDFIDLIDSGEPEESKDESEMDTSQNGEFEVEFDLRVRLAKADDENEWLAQAIQADRRVKFSVLLPQPTDSQEEAIQRQEALKEIALKNMDELEKKISSLLGEVKTKEKSLSPLFEGALLKGKIITVVRALFNVFVPSAYSDPVSREINSQERKIAPILGLVASVLGGIYLIRCSDYSEKRPLVFKIGIAAVIGVAFFSLWNLPRSTYADPYTPPSIARRMTTGNFRSVHPQSLEQLGILLQGQADFYLKIRAQEATTLSAALQTIKNDFHRLERKEWPRAIRELSALEATGENELPITTELIDGIAALNKSLETALEYEALLDGHTPDTLGPEEKVQFEARTGVSFDDAAEWYAGLEGRGSS